MDEYPTDDELETVSKWPIATRKDVAELLDYIKSIWKYADCGYFSAKGNTYKLSTGGWSGNEDIVGAMRMNLIFWALCWYSSKRGGHYVFRMAKIAPRKKETP